MAVIGFLIVPRTLVSGLQDPESWPTHPHPLGFPGQASTPLGKVRRFPQAEAGPQGVEQVAGVAPVRKAARVREAIVHCTGLPKSSSLEPVNGPEGQLRGGE